MLNKLAGFIRQYHMLRPGDRVICAISGGADSVAMTFGLYLLRQTLGIQLEAAHFNHRLRGGESQRDEDFVRTFCLRYDIPLHLGAGDVTPGDRGLEAAARDARYAYFATLPGKIATAHTCDDNAETVLLHLVRGTGLKGLGGIAPVRGNLIRPMLGLSREDVLAFLQEYHLDYVTDSTNRTDTFLRNRLRHHVMPVLKQENPAFARNTSAMALQLRLDEQALEEMSGEDLSVSRLRALPEALRSRCLRRMLQGFGVKEPEAKHIALARCLVFSSNPSARGYFPGNITLARCYDRLVRLETGEEFSLSLEGPGEYDTPHYRLVVSQATGYENSPFRFTVPACGHLQARSRRSGDSIRLRGGTRSLKKAFIDRKIPAHLRWGVPVIATETEVLGVCGMGASLEGSDRTPAWVLEFVPK